jgi:hypothetical protein
MPAEYFPLKFFLTSYISVSVTGKVNILSLQLLISCGTLPIQLYIIILFYEFSTVSKK